MKCPFCGASLPEGARQCVNCGQAVTAAAQANPQSQVVVQVAPITAAPSPRRSAPALAIVALVLGIVAIVISFIPCVGLLAFIPAVLGGIFGLIGLIMALRAKAGVGIAVAGMILSVLSVIWVPLCIFVILGGSFAAISSLVPADILKPSAPSGQVVTSTDPRHPPRPKVIPPSSPNAGPAPTPQPTPPASNAERQLQQKIAGLRAQAGGLPASELWQKVGELRAEVDRLGSTGAASLHQDLDMIVVNGLEAEAKKALENALRYYGRNDYKRTREACAEVRRVYESQAAPRLREMDLPESDTVAQAGALLNEIDALLNPAATLTLGGIIDAGGSVTAFFTDNTTGETLRGKEGDQVGAFVIVSIDQRSRTVQLRNVDEQIFELRKR